ncbi:AAA family ATPase [Paenibacillus sp. FSL L8-0436]|uniref:AAA family ATPase n=1 Tax=Paenibacillus sp. FSL L8-0436 TaxID=2954686 RepID=UPI00315958A1
MNKNFSLKRIYIENFKAIERLELDWSKKQLIVLDGPNGFGKTTIFDAIELVLTGRIDRIKKPEDARVSFNDVLFSNDTTRDLIIKIQFEFDEEIITLAKVLPSTKRLTGIQKQPGRWEIFDTYLLEDFDSVLEEDNKITQFQLNSRFDISELERVYSLFYYIQQQENTSFLKRSGKERLTEISSLFDTTEEVEEMKYFQKVSKYIEQEKKNVAKKIEESTKRIEHFNDIKLLEINGDVKYERLFAEPLNKQWDREDVVISDNQMRDRIINELLSIEDFINNFDEFVNAGFNKQLRKFASDKDLLGKTIAGKSFISDFSEIDKLKGRRSRVQFFISQLQDFQKNYSQINYEKLNDELKLELDTKQIVEIVAQLKNRDGDISQLSKLVIELNNTRDRLTTQMRSLHEHTEDNRGECPFCGFDWGNLESLNNEIQSKSNYFSSLCDESSVKQNTEINQLYEMHIRAAFLELELFLSLPENQLNEVFYREVEVAKQRETDINALNVFCGNNNIEITNFCNIDFNMHLDDGNMKIKIDELTSHLVSHLKRVKEGYSEFDEKYQVFSTLFSQLFGESKHRLTNLTLQKINTKKQYIDWVFFNQISSNRQQETEMLAKYTENHDKLSDKLDELNIIIHGYDQAIKQHWKTIMIDIEIPFHIYSGKIMQNYQRGLGLFIKEKSDTESISFVSDINSDHDALNYLSSGQLSALVISFMLALNKIYGHKDLGILLIDDPVQTMDEINIASLTELLRNDFSHKQIIISTHEEDVSRYLQYKFSKYGLEPSNFNMREESHVK